MFNCGIGGETAAAEEDQEYVQMDKLNELNVSYNTNFFDNDERLLKSLFPDSLRTLIMVNTGV